MHTLRCALLYVTTRTSLSVSFQHMRESIAQRAGQINLLDADTVLLVLRVISVISAIAAAIGAVALVSVIIVAE
jgi:uncharacterized membrane-anchored protein